MIFILIHLLNDRQKVRLRRHPNPIHPNPTTPQDTLYGGGRGGVEWPLGPEDLAFAAPRPPQQPMEPQRGLADIPMSYPRPSEFRNSLQYLQDTMEFPDMSLRRYTHEEQQRCTLNHTVSIVSMLSF